MPAYVPVGLKPVCWCWGWLCTRRAGGCLCSPLLTCASRTDASPTQATDEIMQLNHIAGACAADMLVGGLGCGTHCACRKHLTDSLTSASGN